MISALISHVEAGGLIPTTGTAVNPDVEISTWPLCDRENGQANY